MRIQRPLVIDRLILSFFFLALINSYSLVTGIGDSIWSTTQDFVVLYEEFSFFSLWLSKKWLSLNLVLFLDAILNLAQIAGILTKIKTKIKFFLDIKIYCKAKSYNIVTIGHSVLAYNCNNYNALLNS